MDVVERTGKTVDVVGRTVVEMRRWIFFLKTLRGVVRGVVGDMYWYSSGKVHGNFYCLS